MERFGDITLYNGDGLSLMVDLLKDGIRVDAVITDPPYELDNTGGVVRNHPLARQLNRDKHIDFISNGFDYKRAFELMLKICKIPNLLIFCSNKQISKTMGYFESLGLSVTLLVWHKTNPSPLCNGKHLSDVEFVVYVRAKGATFNNDTPFEYKRKVYTSGVVPAAGRLHPAQKSIMHIARYIELHTKRGDLVLDPFSGSCTTGAACLRTGRRCIACEVDEEIYKTGRDRIREAVHPTEQDLFPNTIHP